MIKDVLRRIDEIDKELKSLEGDRSAVAKQRRKQLEQGRAELLEGCGDLTASDKVFLARHPHRPKIDEYIGALFTDFFVQRGDRQCKDDPSILGGIALYKGRPVTVIGHR